MKSIYNYLTGSFCLITALLLVIGCSDDYKYTTDYSSYKNVKLKVALSDENNVLLVKLNNGTHAITINVTPEDVFIDNKAYIYTISDESIATIALDGTLTMLKKGETELTVKFRGNQEIMTKCKVKVEYDPIYVKDLRVPANGVTVQEFKTVDFKNYITILPATADNQVLRYEIIDNPGAATISEDGIATGAKEGTATVKVTTTDGSDISKTFILHVVGEVKVSRIDLNDASKLEGKTVAIGQAFNLGAIVTPYPTNASEPGLIYSIESGEGVVSVDKNGIVKTLKSGTAIIKIAAADGHGAESKISLKVDASISLFERALWNVGTSIVYSNGKNYTEDGSTGLPEHLIDGKADTYLALTKPGKSYNGNSTPANHQLYFIVDMGTEQDFNYLSWTHRTASSSQHNWFRVFTIAMYGSNDNKTFTLIQEGIDLKASATPTLVELELPQSKYRYVKVELKDWNKSSGSNLAIAEFNLSNK